MHTEKAYAADIDALVRLRLDYLREDHGSIESSDAEYIRNALPDYFRRHLNKDLFVYTVREDQNIVSAHFCSSLKNR